MPSLSYSVASSSVQRILILNGMDTVDEFCVHMNDRDPPGSISNGMSTLTNGEYPPPPSISNSTATARDFPVFRKYTLPFEYLAVTFGLDAATEAF